MIEVSDLHKSFGDQHILKGITTIFEDGKCNLIIGKSGSGKTVLIKCIIGLFDVDNGHIFYDGRDMTEMTFREKKKRIRTEIGMLFQGNALFTSLTVEQNIRFPLDMFTDQSMEEKMERVNFCLERVKLPGVNAKYPSEISGGMMKRVGIARAIVLNPRYLFCDEPNSGLDPRTAIIIDQLIKEITIEYNITTIVNTHDMNSVMGIGDQVIYLHEGFKHWEGNRKEILNTDNKELYDFIFASDFLKQLKEKSA